jgi:hypothetical protein
MVQSKILQMTLFQNLLLFTNHYGNLQEILEMASLWFSQICRFELNEWVGPGLLRTPCSLYTNAATFYVLFCRMSFIELCTVCQTQVFYYSGVVSAVHIAFFLKITNFFWSHSIGIPSIGRMVEKLSASWTPSLYFGNGTRYFMYFRFRHVLLMT